MSTIAKRKISAAATALQLGAVVAVVVYFAYADGVADGQASLKKSVGSDLPADSDRDESGAPAPESTSLDGE